MDHEQRYKPNKENLMAEATPSMSPNVIPNDVPPPSLDTTHSRKPNDSLVNEPATTTLSAMNVTEKASEDQRLAQENEDNTVMAEQDLDETKENPNTTTTTCKEETKAGNNGSSKKKKKNKPKKRKNSTVF